MGRDILPFFMLIIHYPEYTITDDGRVYSHLKPMGKAKGKVLDYSYKREMTPQLTPKGYYQVRLMHKTPRAKTITIHRLVGLHYIPNPNNLETINHINENKIDNRVENLEWMSNRDNILYSKLQTHIIQFPDGSIQTIDNLPVFCEEHNLTHSLLCRTIKRGCQHKGFRKVG